MTLRIPGRVTRAPDAAFVFGRACVIEIDI
jgi:hypothetical protein